MTTDLSPDVIHIEMICSPGQGRMTAAEGQTSLTYSVDLFTKCHCIVDRTVGWIRMCFTIWDWKIIYRIWSGPQFICNNRSETVRWYPLWSSKHQLNNCIKLCGDLLVESQNKGINGVSGVETRYCCNGSFINYIIISWGHNVPDGKLK